MSDQIYAHTHTVEIATTGKRFNFSSKLVGSKEINKADEVADGVTDQAFPIAIDDSEVQSVVISSNQEVSFKVNDAGATPIAITPSSPFTWKNGDSGNAFGEDVTQLLWTNASGSDAVVEVRVIET